ncbi:MAG: family N-acetyltransferase [Bacteroidetes bacterium]|jgi:ribosomal-protein-alanine N-acetyltransferase|nr:family N-acetyltransferase [Bacteroidota bacterium]
MNFSLRPWTINDLDSLVKHANNPNIAKNLTDKFPYPYTAENGKAFISFATQGDPVNVFAIDINGEAVGGIGIHPQTDIQRKNAELGYWLAEPYWGKGIITVAIRQMIGYGFENFDITRIYARPFETNIASKKALEKTGFVFEGRFEKTLYKNGEYLDELIYAIRRNDNFKS